MVDWMVTAAYKTAIMLTFTWLTCDLLLAWHTFF